MEMLFTSLDTYKHQMSYHTQNCFAMSVQDSSYCNYNKNSTYYIKEEMCLIHFDTPSAWYILGT